MRLCFLRPCLIVALFPLLTGTMCNIPGLMQPDMTVDHVVLADFATNTGGASGIAVRPSDGALFAVNANGLFGPLKAGDDLSKLTPFGATNLASASIFSSSSLEGLVLAITTKGEFWIGSACCQTLAVVSAAGGAATAFTQNVIIIKPDTLVIVPAGFDGAQIDPGNLLVAEEAFSRLAAIAVDTDRKVTVVPDASATRNGLHFAFGPQPLLYASRGALDPTLFGIQTVDSSGKPTGLPGTLNTSSKSLVVLANKDLVVRGSFVLASGTQYDGIYLYSNTTQTLDTGTKLDTTQASQSDQMVRLPDGTVLLSLPLQNKIVTVTVIP